ncbi:MAG: hypothetical protein JF595_03020 [Sphingomonadales bacterium]|nr:hypothetical protein [Sphingomonadales bacterium]
MPGSYQETEADLREIVFSAISANGCRLNYVEPHIGVGDVIAVNLGPIGPLRATVRWRHESSAGVEFDEPLEFAIAEFFAAYCGAAA